MKTILATATLSLMSATIDGMPGVCVGILALFILLIAGVRMHVNDQRSRFHYEDKF